MTTATARPFAKYIVHAVGLLLVVAGVAAWAHLLRQPAPHAAPAQVQGTQADPTADALAAWFGPGELRANIAVKGLIKSADQGVVVLAVNDAPARPYQVGEALARSVTLKAIEADAVVIDKAGTPERIAAPVIPQPATPGIVRATPADAARQ
ncbi:type II secretion system protein N [Variovorax sp. PAMC26660]|uniref:type II secretion system protein N n=1 Tax=Variovorax sp. PAMC26660 TaxID=2762322 RepID=UPI00164DB6F8|nr:type II secretion system protein N [Variovorax sp. PAMC26660]QNK67009.1 general secretion pathway protein GspC [Variovorax sp. PAMC26660]